MTETTATCGRCSRTIGDTPIGVSVDGGPLRETDPILRICPECAASLCRWLERGRCRAASPGPMVQEPMDADDQPRHRKHQCREDRRHQQRKALLRNIALITLLVVVNLLVIMIVAERCQTAFFIETCGFVQYHLAGEPDGIPQALTLETHITFQARQGERARGTSSSTSAADWEAQEIHFSISSWDFRSSGIPSSSGESSSIRKSLVRWLKVG